MVYIQILRQAATMVGTYSKRWSFGAIDNGYRSIGPESCGIIKSPNVVSVSYAQDEAVASLAYAQRQCSEYAKVRYVLWSTLSSIFRFYSSEWWGHLWFTVVEILVLQAGATVLPKAQTSAWTANVCFGPPLKYYLCFWRLCMKIKKLIMGQSLTHRFLYVQTWFLLLPMTHCSTSVDVSVRNVCRSNPDEIRIYGRWPGGSCNGLLGLLVCRVILLRRWLLKYLPVRLTFDWSSDSDIDKIKKLRLPEYQRSAVEDYSQKYLTPSPFVTGQYNDSGNVGNLLILSHCILLNCP